MVRPEPVEGTVIGCQCGECGAERHLTEAADRYVESKRAWAEAYLRYKLADPLPGQKAVTDNQAKAQADIEVNPARAEVDWYLAQRGTYVTAEPGD